jgi:hypothetical protein
MLGSGRCIPDLAKFLEDIMVVLNNSRERCKIYFNGFEPFSSVAKLVSSHKLLTTEDLKT